VGEYVEGKHRIREQGGVHMVWYTAETICCKGRYENILVVRLLTGK